MLPFNVIELQPTRTYATPENAIKAVTKYAEGITYPGRAFNVLILDCRKGGMGADAEDRRYYPVLCNIASGFLHVALHSGFIVVN